MTDGATPATPVDAPSAATIRGLIGPPGALFYLATIGAILLGLDANTRQSFALLLLVVPIWLLLAVVWLVRFLLGVTWARGRMSVAHWARWLVIPLALGVVFALSRTDALLQARFNLSRDALDAMARDVASGGSLDRGWVGLYDVGTPERTANGFWFVIDDSGLGRWGLAYSPDGVPKESEETYSGLWTGAEFEHLNGPWWIFTQSWD